MNSDMTFGSYTRACLELSAADENLLLKTNSIELMRISVRQPNYKFFKNMILMNCLHEGIKNIKIKKSF